MQEINNRSSSESKDNSNTVRDYTTTITILEHLSDAIFILNPVGQIEYANRVALDMLGLKLEELIGKNLDHYLLANLQIDQLYDSGKQGYLLENIFKGVYSEIETSLVNQDYIRPIVISFGLVKNSSGQINYIIASAKDISMKKELEKEVQQQQLISLSRDRYRELGELAVNMVHNLSQPITSVRLLVELSQNILKKENADPAALQRNLTNIVELLDFMSNSITNVRNFAFLTEDESVKQTSITTVLEDTLQQISYELSDRDIQVRISGAEKLPAVLANPINLQQVFVTIIKYFGSEFEKLKKDGQKPDANDQRIEISLNSVKESWIQINLKDNIAERDTKPADGKETLSEQAIIGTSLDLTITQIILNSIGGDIKMRCREGGGSEFNIRIPIDQKNERDQLLSLIELMHSQ